MCVVIHLFHRFAFTFVPALPPLAQSHRNAQEKAPSPRVHEPRRKRSRVTDSLSLPDSRLPPSLVSRHERESLSDATVTSRLRAGHPIHTLDQKCRPASRPTFPVNSRSGGGRAARGGPGAVAPQPAAQQQHTLPLPPPACAARRPRAIMCREREPPTHGHRRDQVVQGGGRKKDASCRKKTGDPVVAPPLPLSSQAGRVKRRVA